MPTTWDCRRPANVWCNKSVNTQCFATVEPPCADANCGNWVLETCEGHLALGYILNGDAYFKWSKYSWPALGWDHEVRVTTLGDVVCFRFDLNRLTSRIHAVISRNISGTLTNYETWSDDYGATWSTPV